MKSNFKNTTVHVQFNILKLRALKYTFKIAFMFSEDRSTVYGVHRKSDVPEASKNKGYLSHVGREPQNGTCGRNLELFSSILVQRSY